MALSPLRQALAERVLLLDGAMGTELQRRGIRGNNDALLLTNPEVIFDVHCAYLEAGADIIETCTFNSQSISQCEYGLDSRIRDLNLAGARLARKAADRYTALTPHRPRFVVGSIGPTGKMLSMVGEGDNLITFDSLEAAYCEQIEALIEGGVDALLFETVFDTLNLKAALSAALKVMSQSDRQVEIMVSASVSSEGGRLLSGQDIEAYVCSLSSYPLLSIGLNCSFGPDKLSATLRRLSDAAPWFVSIHPNAGLPDEMGRYTVDAEDMASYIKRFITSGAANIVGGCCGTTPEHIAAMRRVIDSLPSEFAPRTPVPFDGRLMLSGCEPLIIDHTFVNVGERCNVAGSRKFLRLISTGAHEEALEIAADQVEAGAMVLDVNMDDGMLDSRAEMCRFMRMVSSHPVASRVPVMVDSSRFDVIEDALKCLQGKSIVNSISLKQGEDEFLRQASIVHRLGAAVIVMAFDEQGQATTYPRRVEICTRAYRLLTEKAGFAPHDIIFDPNILTVATGIADHALYAVDFVRTAQYIHKNLPGARVSGGVSNLSFAFRGHNYVREAMHAVFLYRAIQSGMDMAIMNPASKVAYPDITPELRAAIEDVLFDKCTPESVEHLTAMAAKIAGDEASTSTTSDVTAKALPLNDRLAHALVSGNSAHLADDLAEALAEGQSPLAIIEGPLMEGMNSVGRLFAEGKMFLPQVVKTARTMKCAVDILQPAIEQQLESNTRAGRTSSLPRVLLATVKGDVHDIGKNIVGIILSCNGYQIIDLGVMVTADTIVRQAIEQQADIICLSGLITPSLDEMCRTVEAIEDAGLRVPVMIGGATTSPLHTAIKIAPLYSGIVVHAADAAVNPVIASRLLGSDAEAFAAEIRLSQQHLRQAYAASQRPTPKHVSAPESTDWSAYAPAKVPFEGIETLQQILVKDVRQYIDWQYFYHAWKVDADSQQARELLDDANRFLDEIACRPTYAMSAAYGFFPAKAAQNGSAIIVDALATKDRTVAIATLRQASPDQGSDHCLSLCDFVSPLVGDHIGVFAATVSQALVDDIARLQTSGDHYAALLYQTVAHRLAEATSEYLHTLVKAQTGTQSIRPAVGYPSLPDQRAIFDIDSLLRLSRVGIALTENGAMAPDASVAGIYILNPKARYFNAR